MIKLSIIIPTYNNAELLKELLNKLLLQRDKLPLPMFERNVEIIVINDGSTENMDFLRLYSQDVIIVNKVNGGAASARNVGLNTAKGDYIVFVDSDDDVSEDFIEKILSYVNLDPGADIQYFKCTCEDGSVAYHEPCAWGKVVRRRYIGDARFDEKYNIGEEDTLFLPLMRKKPPVVLYRTGVLYHYRWSANPDSLMKRYWRGELPKIKE